MHKISENKRITDAAAQNEYLVNNMAIILSKCSCNDYSKIGFIVIKNITLYN
jgi:hypothetical protein